MREKIERLVDLLRFRARISEADANAAKTANDKEQAQWAFGRSLVFGDIACQLETILREEPVPVLTICQLPQAVEVRA